VKTSDQIALLSAVISFIALGVTLVFAVLNRKYTRQQIKLLANQVEDQRKQFEVANTPDVTVEIFVRGGERKRALMRATNNHPTIPVGNLIAVADGTSPSQKPFHFRFGTMNDLKPQETIEVEHLGGTLEEFIRASFPGYEEDGGMISESVMRGGKNSESFPMTLTYSYLPRLAGATKVERSRPLFILVWKKNAADRADRLFADAERIAESITEESAKAEALARVVRALAAAKPDRAERIARSITGETDKALALGSVAEALAATDPDRAERIAESITSDHWKASALGSVAGALAATDPDRAERIAQSITSQYWRASALGSVAGALAATDPHSAERLFADAARIAQSITDDHWKGQALGSVAEALAATDPDRAERIAQSITDEYRKAWTLADVARTLAATDPHSADRLFADAARIAQSITDDHPKGQALDKIAEALAATDPDRAERIAERSLTSIGRHGHWAASRGHWQLPTPTVPNASPNRSPRSLRRHGHWPTLRGRWQLPTPTVPKASPSRSPASLRRHQREPASRRCWQRRRARRC
jgi:hypothetical protein